MNLLGNAIKFTDNGHVYVEIGTERDDGPDTVLLRGEVRDSGVGIPEDRFESIFESFTQADSSVSRRFGGTGLGLAITQTLLKMMDGDVSVESELGAGSTFSFHARLRAADEAPNDVELAELPDVSVLIVDDSPINRRILHENIVAWGLRAAEAESGADALTMLEQHQEEGEPFDLVLLDVQMPDVDGYAVAREIRESGRHGSPEIIVVSSLDAGGDALKFRGMGVAGYLTKPIKQSQLLEEVQRVMAGTVRAADPARDVVSEESEDVAAVGTGRVLLVEDNPTNRKLAHIMLSKAGYEVLTANDGRMAVDTIGRESVDLVLMDVQVLDGYSAAREIRQEERFSGLPIIAMTAHALKGDRENALDAGMDDYLSKPVRKDDLLAMVAKWMPADIATDVAEPEPSEGAPIENELPVFEADQLRALVDNDEEAFVELLASFRHSGSNLVRELAEADSGDAAGRERLRNVAHTLKGTAGSFHALRVQRLAAELESACAAGSDEPVGDLVSRVEAEWRDFLDEIDS